MLADFYIPRLSNNMKIAVQENNLGGQIWYRSLDPVKKRRLWALPLSSPRSQKIAHQIWRDNHRPIHQKVGGTFQSLSSADNF